MYQGANHTCRRSKLCLVWIHNRFQLWLSIYHSHKWLDMSKNEAFWFLWCQNLCHPMPFNPLLGIIRMKVGLVASEFAAIVTVICCYVCCLLSMKGIYYCNCSSPFLLADVNLVSAQTILAWHKPLKPTIQWHIVALVVAFAAVVFSHCRYHI